MKIICDSCGKIYHINKMKTFNCSCGAILSCRKSFPVLAAQNYINSANDLYNLCKRTDKKNLNRIIKTLKTFFQKDNINVEIDVEKMVAVLKLYESIKKNYLIYDDEETLKMLDEFENQCKQKYVTAYNVMSYITSSFTVYWKNNYRKPYIVISSSAIEMLFNDYIKTLALSRLSKKCADNFLKQSNNLSIPKKIKIIGVFIDEGFISKVNAIDNKYMNSWSELRKLRNKIIHSNSIFITDEHIELAKLLIAVSIEIFAKLKSDIYSLQE